MLQPCCLQYRRLRVQNLSSQNRRRATVAADGAAARPRIEFDDLVEVIKAMDESNVVEMEIKGKRFAMTVRKQEALKAMEPIYVQAAAPSPGPAYAPPPPQAAPPSVTPPPAPAMPNAASSGAAIAGFEIVAPMSGTVYRKPAPGEPVFVKEGDQVVKGQSICIIEAMKLMNEIEADISGTVVKFVAEDAAPIEPGEVICVIDPK